MKIVSVLGKPYFWVIIASLLIFVYNIFNKNDNFMDVKKVIKNHYSIFNKNYFQIAFFIVVPLLMSIGFVIEKSLDESLINILSVVFSILIAMFFSVFAMLMPLKSEVKRNDEKSIIKEKVMRVIKQSNDTLIFEILISVVVLIMLLAYSIFENSMLEIISRIISFIIYFLSNVVFINIFIVVKRLKVIFDTLK